MVDRGLVLMEPVRPETDPVLKGDDEDLSYGNYRTLMSELEERMQRNESGEAKYIDHATFKQQHFRCHMVHKC